MTTGFAPGTIVWAPGATFAYVDDSTSVFVPVLSVGIVVARFGPWAHAKALTLFPSIGVLGQTWTSALKELDEP